ncbi:riboflavin kinase [Hypoxylon sp. NC1633]|nr:riboflavin kinase [Hypoxylon sp. NC1633]
MAAAHDRPRILYADSGPEPPYPLRMEGTVISGFGRGSKELGIPTANLPVDESATPWISTVKSGVYFGYASLALPATHPDRQTQRHRSNPRAPVNAPPSTLPASSPSTAPPDHPQEGSGETKESNQQTSTSTSTGKWQIYPMVMSIGYNPFYKNSVRSAEVHLLHAFGADFYDAPMRLLILGFVRDERDYASLDALVDDINVDCDVARQSLARPAWTPREGLVGAGAGEFDGGWLVRD